MTASSSRTAWLRWDLHPFEISIFMGYPAATCVHANRKWDPSTIILDGGDSMASAASALPTVLQLDPVALVQAIPADPKCSTIAASHNRCITIFVHENCFPPLSSGNC